MRKGRTTRFAVAVSALVVALTCAAVAGAAFTPGSSGLGDPFFPLAGNGGYDVSHYSLTLDYTPSTNQLAGVDVITATATQDLSRFDLDLRGFSISQLTVNGQAATFSRDGQELIITPRTRIRSGSTFTVDRRATPGRRASSPIRTGRSRAGCPTDDGAFVVGEPQGSPAWYPVNDNPRDKATYDFAVTVPEGLTVMANGVLDLATTRPAARRPGSGARTTRWRRTSRPRRSAGSTSPVSSVDGIPSYVAVDPTLSTGNVLRQLPDIVEFYTSIYGPYPVRRGRRDRRRRQGRRLLAGDADEAGLRPDAGRGDARPRALAHVVRRLGDADDVAGHLAARGVRHLVRVDLERAPGQQVGGAVVQAALQHAGAGHRVLDAAARRSGHARRSCSTGRSTTAAAMTLQALREKIGDGDFFRIMRDWAQQNRFGNVTTAQFIALAEQVSGIQLDHFFDVWLYQPEKPTSW